MNLALAASTVEFDQGTFTAVAVAGGVLAAVLLIAWWRSRRQIVRRLSTATVRLEDEASSAEPKSVERSLSRLEGAAQPGVAPIPGVGTQRRDGNVSQCVSSAGRRPSGFGR